MRHRTPGGEAYWRYSPGEEAQAQAATKLSIRQRELFQQAVAIGTVEAYQALPEDVRAKYSILTFTRNVERKESAADAAIIEPRRKQCH